MRTGKDGKWKGKHKRKTDMGARETKVRNKVRPEDGKVCYKLVIRSRKANQANGKTTT